MSHQTHPTLRYLTNFYKKYLQNLKYNVKRICIFHLILFDILSILISILSVKNRDGLGGVLNRQNPLSVTKVICRQSLKNEFGQFAKHVQKFPKNHHTLGQYYKIKRKYKHTIKTIKQNQQIENIRILENQSSDSKLFWQHVKKIKGKTNNTPNQVDSIPPNKWVEHFSSLLWSKKVTKVRQKVAIKSFLITNVTLSLIPCLQLRKFQKDQRTETQKSQWERLHQQ